MDDADRTNNTEQLQRFINNLWQHQQKNEFCDFTLTTNSTSIECHKLVLSSASSYFSQLLCNSEHGSNIIDVTPLPEHILRTIVAFMYNSEYVINDENVIELLKFSRTWNLDILARLCVTYMNGNVTINNACRWYNSVLDHVDECKSYVINKFIREHFTSLHESGQLRELSLKNFTTIVEHDEINVKNEDVIFSSAVQIINQESFDEDVNRCLELIRFPHTSGHFLEKVILNHPLMKEPPRDIYVSEALTYQLNKTSRPEVKPPRYWRRRIYYLGKGRSFYHYVSNANHDESRCIKMTNIPEWLDYGSSVASYRERVVIVGRHDGGAGDKRALLLDMRDNTKVTQLPNLPEPLSGTSVLLSANDVYVIGGRNKSDDPASSVYYLSLGNNAWQTKKAMLCVVRSPLVTQHQQGIYVLGGLCNGYPSSILTKYNIKDDTWKQCSDMPVACSIEEAGVVVHEDKIKVFTVDKCLMYADDTDTWTVKQYDKLGYEVNVFVKSGQIWAAVLQPYNVYSMMSYDDVDNVWKTEHERIEKVYNTKFFC